MSAADLGQVIVPTGGGKTFIMIQDALRALSSGPKTIVVVAPRILLANQLCDEFMQQISATWTHVAHCHSGETHYFSSTKSDKIECFVKTARAAGESAIVFTTYHSLGRVVDAGVDIDVYTLMKHTTVLLSLSLSIHGQLHNLLNVVTSSLLHLVCLVVITVA